ncbi:MAG: T9SS type A sorting domain-containing protein, partial [candidate division Zixibacteria bacterium]|nr:T9SS type A sorting domain-containing protein [candidate division Zixibacteria bacterium]
FEPQLGTIVVPGDFSLNDYTKHKWYGYFYSALPQQWVYSSYGLVYFELPSGNLTNSLNGIVTSWSPFQQTNTPQNQNYEYSTTLDTDTSTTGSPTNLYPGTNVSFTDSSTQTNNFTSTDVNFDIYRNWEMNAGAYDTSFVQTISVNDNTPPYDTSFPNDTTVNEGEDFSPVNLGSPQYSDNSNLQVTVGYYDVLIYEDNLQQDWERAWMATDISGNTSLEKVQLITILKPQNIGEPFYENFKIYPNPGKGFIHFVSETHSDIRVFNVTGKSVTDKIYWSNKYINLSQKPAGIYFIRIINKNDTERFIKYIKF